MQLQAAGKSWRIEPCELLVFRGDQRHSYKNVGTEPAVASSVLAFSPASGNATVSELHRIRVELGRMRLRGMV